MTEKKFKIVNDLFIQCENKQCKKWCRLYPIDEEGLRTVPLLSIDPKRYRLSKITREIWVCDDCWDENDEILARE